MDIWTQQTDGSILDARPGTFVLGVLAMLSVLKIVFNIMNTFQYSIYCVLKVFNIMQLHFRQDLLLYLISQGNNQVKDVYYIFMRTRNRHRVCSHVKILSKSMLVFKIDLVLLIYNEHLNPMERLQDNLNSGPKKISMRI